MKTVLCPWCHRTHAPSRVEVCRRLRFPKRPGYQRGQRPKPDYDPHDPENRDRAKTAPRVKCWGAGLTVRPEDVGMPGAS